MKHLALCLLALLTFSCSTNKDNPESIQIGAAYESITPNIGAFIAGDKNNRQFESVHDSLFVKAVYLSDGDTQLAMIVFDCIGMLHPTLLDIRAEVAKRIPANELNPDHIVMTSTHTHSGPDVVGIWGANQMSSGVDSTYMEKVIEQSVKAIETAWKNQQTAHIVYGQGQFGEDWVFNISDSLNLDRSLNVLQFIDEEDQSIATFTNFACHPTIMDGNSSAVSADYVGATYAALNKQIGGVNFFLQGAIGGWVQPEYEDKTFESVNFRGNELADKILNLLSAPQPMHETGLDFKSKQFNLPVSNNNFKILSQIGVIKRPIEDSVNTEIAWFSIGNAAFATHPGETTPTHSFQTKALMKNEGPKFILGLGMDALGYILTSEFYEDEPDVRHSEYLKGMSIDPKAGELLLAEIEQLILPQN